MITTGGYYLSRILENKGQFRGGREEDHTITPLFSHTITSFNFPAFAGSFPGYSVSTFKIALEKLKVKAASTLMF